MSIDQNIATAHAGALASAADALESHAYAVGLQAFVQTYPQYFLAKYQSQFAPRKNLRGMYAGPDPGSRSRWANVLAHNRSRLTPEQDKGRGGGPNVDTLYTGAWLQLAARPIVLHAPDTGGRYYVVELISFNNNYVAHLGSRTTGTAEGRFLLCGPDWQGAVPEGMTLVRCETNEAWMLIRIYVADEADTAAANALQDRFRTWPLDAPDGDPPFDGDRIEARMAPDHEPADAADYFGLVQQGLLLNPLSAGEDGILAGLRHFGIGPGRCDSEGWTPAVRRGLDRAVAEGLRIVGLPDDPRGGWIWQNPVAGFYGDDHLLRARNAVRAPGLLGMEEAIYFFSEFDSDDRPLSGSQRYRLVFAPGGLPPVDCFWSLSLYAKPRLTLVPNPLRRHSIGDRTAGLRHGADGSLSLFISAASPQDDREKSNWLPAPEGEFLLILRAYLPRRDFVEGRYRLPLCERQ